MKNRSPDEVPIRNARQLGGLIAAARRQKSQTQREVAKALGVTQAWISRVEKGRERAWVGQILRLAVYLELELFARVPEEEKPRAPAPASQTPFFPEHDDWVD